MRIKELGEKVTEMLEKDLSTFIADFNDQDRENLKTLGKAITRVAADAVQGKDVSQNMAHIQAQISHYKSAYQGMLRDRLGGYLKSAFNMTRDFVAGQLGMS